MNEVTYKKILVTSDGSKLSLTALPHAQALGKLTNAQILLLTVILPFTEETVMMGNDAGLYAATLQNVNKKTMKARRQQANRKLKRLKADFEKNGLTNVKTSVKEGYVQEVIVDFAKTEHCDLIIMATHGRSGIVRTLLGSVTDHVVRHATCPLLIVRPQIIKKNKFKTL